MHARAVIAVTVHWRPWAVRSSPPRRHPARRRAAPAGARSARAVVRASLGLGEPSSQTLSLSLSCQPPIS
eukprot:5968094-Prymnesium_polylepis.1